MTKIFSALRFPHFRCLWIGQAVSQLGDAMYFLVFLYMLDKITENPMLVGLAMALQALPFILLGPLAGATADRLDRKKIMLSSDVLSAVIMAGVGLVLWLFPSVIVQAILSASLLLSVVNVYFLPAKSASIPNLLPHENLQEANALSQATQSLMPLIGIGLSGGLLASLERVAPNFFFGSAIILNLFTFLFSAFWIAKLPNLKPSRDEETHEPSKVLQDIKIGLSVCAKDPVIATTAVLGFLLNLFISPFMLVYVAVNRDWFGGKFSTLAIFEVSFILSMLLTSLWIGQKKFSRPALAMGLGMFFVGMFVIPMGWSKTVFLFAFWNVICGIGVPFQIPLSTHIQITTPDNLRGRVQSVFAMSGSIATPISNGIAGVLLTQIGAQSMFLVMGLGMMLSALGALAVPGFRKVKVELAQNPL